MASTAEARTPQNYAGGDWFDSIASEALDDRDPATGELTARVPLSVAADVDRAVAAGRVAPAAWRQGRRAPRAPGARGGGGPPGSCPWGPPSPPPRRAWRPSSPPTWARPW